MSLCRSFCSPGVHRSGLFVPSVSRRPLPPPVQAQISAPSRVQQGVQSARWETTTTGDDKSGHINAPTAGEGILFLDNVFPLRVGNVLAWRPWRTSSDGYNDADIKKLLQRFQKPGGASSSAEQSSSSSLLSPVVSFFDPVSLVQRAIPPDLPLTITEIIPRLKDGGVFVKFRQADAAAAGAAGANMADIEARVAQRLSAHPVRPWFKPFWGRVRAGLVRGVPWLEDLASRIPSSRVRVEFCPAAGDAAGGAGSSSSLELSQETLYSLFRRYGKIAEITGQPSDSKTLPRYATIDFLHVRDAIMARSCLHGHVVRGTATRLSLAYEARVRAHHVWNWLTSHPRIVVPILAALLAAVTVAVFDPIRIFFIRAHVHHSFVLRDSTVYKWFQRRTAAAVELARSSYGAAADKLGGAGAGTGTGPASRAIKGGREALMSHRRDLLESLHTWLLETAGTFIVVQGPRGSGKSELVVDQALHGRHDVLVVDCKPLVEARGESATIKKLAAAVGYRPVFSWANNLSSLIDLAVQGTTGVKTGFSETLDEQVVKILQTATVALRDVGLANRNPKTDVDADLNDDAYLEAHPERRPVVVLRNFGGSGGGSTAGAASGPLYDKLAEWAATLVTANIAHVVFLTTDTGYPKSLVKALPDRVFRQIALGDLSPPVAMNYVLGHLAAKDAVDEDGDGEPDEDAAAAAAEPVAAPRVQTQAQPQQKEAKQEESSSLLALVEKNLPFGKKDEKKPEAPPPLKDPLLPPTQAATAAAALTSTGPASSPRAIARAARLYAQSHPDTIRELEGCIGVLGGRLTDLESLVRRLKSGQSPQRAVSEIVEQSASEIIKMFLLVPPGRAGAGGAGGSGGGGGGGAKAAAAGSSGPGSAGASSGAAAAGSGGGASGASGSASAAGPGGGGVRSWTPEQAWFLVRELGALSGNGSKNNKKAAAAAAVSDAATPSLQYSQVLLSDVFSGSGEVGDAVAAIDALAVAELITVKSSANGRPQTIRAGRPVYEAAFAHLRADKPLAARLDRNLLAERTALETKKISKCEQELAVLSSLQLLRMPSPTMERAAYLLKKLETAQAKIEQYEAEMARLGKVMQEE